MVLRRFEISSTTVVNYYSESSKGIISMYVDLYFILDGELKRG